MSHEGAPGQRVFFFRSVLGVLIGSIFAGCSILAAFSTGALFGEHESTGPVFTLATVIFFSAIAFPFVFIIGGTIHFCLQLWRQTTFASYAIAGSLVGGAIFLLTLFHGKSSTKDFTGEILAAAIFIAGAAAAAVGFRLGFGELANSSEE